MADGKIYITISDTRGGSGAGVSNEADKAVRETKEKSSTLGAFAQHSFFNFIEGQAKQFVNYSINNIGNFTGNYQAQEDAQNVMKGISFVANLGTAIYTGAKAGGIWGAAIAGTISIGGSLINWAYQEHTEKFQNRKINRNIDMMRRRLGLEGLTDGSRTGGY